MAVVNKKLSKIERPEETKKVNKNKIRLAITIKRFLDISFLFVILFLFYQLVMNYNQNIKYQDETNIIKYHDFWYAIYDKEKNLKDIYFYNWFQNDLDLIQYIQEKIILQNDTNLLVRLLSKEKTWYDNFINIPWLNWKNTVNELKWYNIRGIFTEDDNKEKFVMVYSQEKSPNNIDYCFVVNTLSMSDVSAKCINKNSANLPVSFIKYKEYYFISIDKEIQVYDYKNQTIIANIQSNTPIKWLSTNNEWDIKVKLEDKTKEVKWFIIEYNIIKKHLDNNDKIINLSLDKL